MEDQQLAELLTAMGELFKYRFPKRRFMWKLRELDELNPRMAAVGTHWILGIFFEPWVIIIPPQGGHPGVLVKAKDRATLQAIRSKTATYAAQRGTFLETCAGDL